MQKLLVATSNPGKFSEIMEVLKGLPFEFLFLGDLEIDDSGPVEDGETFKENAYKKAKCFFDKTGMLTLAEDSGILVDALGGELGVKTRRWGAGENASDEEWIEYFLKRMEGEIERGARFICNACLVGGDRESEREGDEGRGGERGGSDEGRDGSGSGRCDEGRFFEGETRGVITENLQAPILRGLPLSSCFLPEGCDKVYAALGAHKKNKISHRGKAIGKVREYLKYFA